MSLMGHGSLVILSYKLNSYKIKCVLLKNAFGQWSSLYCKHINKTMECLLSRNWYIAGRSYDRRWEKILSSHWLMNKYLLCRNLNFFELQKNSKTGHTFFQASGIGIYAIEIYDSAKLLRFATARCRCASQKTCTLPEKMLP